MDKTTVQDALTHLSALGFVEGDTVYMNCLKPSMKIEFVYPDIPLTSINKAESKELNIFFAPNKGGYLNKDIDECQVLFYEHDDLDKETSANLWRTIGLPEPTIQIDTGNKSVHTYYALTQPISSELFKEAQALLIKHLKSDIQIKNPARLMRLCGGIHPKSGVAATIYSHSGNLYSIEDLMPILQEYKAITPKAKVSTQVLVDDIEEAREALKAITDFTLVDSEYHWHRIGMSCKYISELLFDDWVQWSHGSPEKAAKTNFKERWDSWKGNGIKRATLFQYAKDCGWRSPSPKYQPNESGNFDHLDDEPPLQRSVFGSMVDKIYGAIGNKLSYNSFTCRLIYDGEEKQADYVSIQIQDTLNIDIPRRLFDSREVVKAVAQRNQFHPILDYLNSCKPKNGVSHLNVATKYLGATEAVEDEYFAAFLKAAVLRQINTATPTEYHFILVLLGATGCGKTSTFKLLFKTWFYDMKSFNGSEWKEGVAKSWLCFWDEMSPVLGNKKHAEINGFITQSQDFYHELYETKAKLRIRPFVIGGTTTETEFLSENPSLRRFNVVKMEALDRVSFERDVDAIWASAYADALANPTMQEVSTFADIEARNQEFIRGDDYDSIIERMVKVQLSRQGYVWVAQLIEEVLTSKISLPKDFGYTVECYLKRNQFRRDRTYNADKKRIRVWFPK